MRLNFLKVVVTAIIISVSFFIPSNLLFEYSFADDSQKCDSNSQGALLLKDSAGVVWNKITCQDLGNIKIAIIEYLKANKKELEDKIGFTEKEIGLWITETDTVSISSEWAKIGNWQIHQTSLIGRLNFSSGPIIFNKKAIEMGKKRSDLDNAFWYDMLVLKGETGWKVYSIDVAGMYVEDW
jgi:hypothetical protein